MLKSSGIAGPAPITWNIKLELLCRHIPDRHEADPPRMDKMQKAGRSAYTAEEQAETT